MNQPDKDQNRRLIRIILVSWFLGLLLGIAGVTYATVEISKIKQAQETLANRPAELRTVETKLQPIYNTIEGTPGQDGKDGKDSVSTHTETVVQNETAIVGPTGKSGKNGANGRSIELAIDPVTGTWYQRYVGDDYWSPVTIIAGTTP